MDRRQNTLKEFKAYKNIRRLQSAIKSRFYDTLILQMQIVGEDLTAAGKYLRAGLPSLPTPVVQRVETAASYAALNSALSVTAILDLIIANAGTIWDLRSREMQFQSGDVPITADGQPIDYILPFSGNRGLNVDTNYGPVLSDQIGGAFFGQTSAALRFTRFTAPVFFAVVNPTAEANPNGSRTWLLGDAYEYNFHPAQTGEPGLFSPQYSSVWNQQLQRNGVTVLNADLPALSAAPTAPVLYTIDTSPTYTAVGSIADDRGFLAQYGRTFYGYYRFFMMLYQSPTADQKAALNTFVMRYAGLI